MNKELTELYSDYLLSSFGATTATGLSDMLEGEVSHDRITRFPVQGSLRLQDPLAAGQAHGEKDGTARWRADI